MFNFFRRTAKKDSSEVPASPGENSNTCAATSENNPLASAKSSGSNVLKPSQTAANDMAPMAAQRGKGKGKKKPPLQQPPPPQNEKRLPQLVKTQERTSIQNHLQNSTLKQENKQPAQIKNLNTLVPQAEKQEKALLTNQENNRPMQPQQLTKTLNTNLQQKEKQENTNIQQEKNLIQQSMKNQLQNSTIKQENKQLITNQQPVVQQNSLSKPEDKSLIQPQQIIKSQNNQTELQKEKRPLPYAKILQRLDSIPPMNSTPEPEKRRHSVKPCSHVTVPSTPRLSQMPSTPSPPSGSPVAAVRHFRPAKQSKIDPDQDTVVATMKLQIDLPANIEDKKQVTNSECTVKTSDSGLKQMQVNSVSGKQNGGDDEKRNLVNQETQFQTQLTDLSERLRVRDAETNELRSQMENLQRDLYVKSSGVDRLQAELTAAHKESEFVRQKLRHLQDEVQQYKQKNLEMVEELQTKTEEYKTLEDTSKSLQSQLESSIQSLQSKLSSLESQFSSIREERDRLEQHRLALESEREEEKRIVQEALDAATAENDTIRRRWEQDFEKLRTVNTDREQQMLDDFEWKLREVQAACKKRLDEKDKLNDQKIKEFQKDVDIKVKMAEQQMNEVVHLKSYEAEVTQLRGLTNDQQHSLRTMSSRVEELQTTNETLQEEIAKLQATIEIEKQHQLSLIQRHEKDLSDKERALQIRLDKQRGEIAVQWEQKLRQECARLSAELEQMHSDEKQLAVELVRVQKDREFDAVREKFEGKIKSQVKEIDELKSCLLKKEEKFQSEIERLRTNTDRDIVELRRELDKSEMAFHERTEKLLAEHEQELDRINEEADRRIKEVELNSQMQVSSMRATLELVKEQAVRESEERIQHLEEDHQRAQDELWERLTSEKEQQIERIEDEYKTKFEKIKDQFTIVQKSHQNKEQELLGKIADLKTSISEKSSTIESLQANVDTLHGGVQVLRQEITLQDQQLNKVKTEAEQKIGELQHALKVERDTLQVEREEHIEEVTHIQKQSQGNLEQLQRRCQCLTKLFEDMRSRYDKRESRQEDLNLIADLRAIIAEQERDLAVLNEEKRYFQMKLIQKKSSASPDSPHGWKNAGNRSRSSSVESEIATSIPG